MVPCAFALTNGERQYTASTHPEPAGGVVFTTNNDEMVKANIVLVRRVEVSAPETTTAVTDNN